MQLIFQQQKRHKSPIDIFFLQIDMLNSTIKAKNIPIPIPKSPIPILLPHHLSKLSRYLTSLDHMRTQIQIIPLLFHLFINHLQIYNLQLMHPQSNKNTIDLKDDIFDTQVMKMDVVKQEKRFLQALRISVMARGDNNMQYFTEISFKTRPQKQLKLSYQQQTIKQYGFQGILMKESPNFFGGWEQRYCILKGNRFVYKENRHATSPNAGIINFNLLSCTIQGLKSGQFYSQFRIKIHHCDKIFVFRAENDKETHEWVQKLYESNSTSEGYQKGFTYLTHYPRFWRKDYISLAQFSKTAETGDVILFRGSKNTSVMQRALTGDEFDHVAAVIMNCKSEPLIFEANGGFGVGIMPWSQFISKKFYANYDLVVHRHLNMSRNQEFSQIVDKFVQGNMGKQYDFSLKEYLFSRTSSSQGDKQVYFCSSLVAKLYKNLEILKPNISSTQYLPSWFSNKGGQLRKDGKFGLATFDDQKILVFQNLS